MRNTKNSNTFEYALADVSDIIRGQGKFWDKLDIASAEDLERGPGRFCSRETRLGRLQSALEHEISISSKDTAKLIKDTESSRLPGKEDFISYLQDMSKPKVQKPMGFGGKLKLAAAATLLATVTTGAAYFTSPGSTLAGESKEVDPIAIEQITDEHIIELSMLTHAPAKRGMRIAKPKYEDEEPTGGPKEKPKKEEPKKDPVDEFLKEIEKENDEKEKLKEKKADLQSTITAAELLARMSKKEEYKLEQKETILSSYMELEKLEPGQQYRAKIRMADEEIETLIAKSEALLFSHTFEFRKKKIKLYEDLEKSEKGDQYDAQIAAAKKSLEETKTDVRKRALEGVRESIDGKNLYAAKAKWIPWMKRNPDIIDAKTVAKFEGEVKALEESGVKSISPIKTTRTRVTRPRTTRTRLPAYPREGLFEELTETDKRISTELGFHAGDVDGFRWRTNFGWMWDKIRLDGMLFYENKDWEHKSSGDKIKESTLGLFIDAELTLDRGWKVPLGFTVLDKSQERKGNRYSRSVSAPDIVTQSWDESKTDTDPFYWSFNLGAEKSGLKGRFYFVDEKKSSDNNTDIRTDIDSILLGIDLTNNTSVGVDVETNRTAYELFLSKEWRDLFTENSRTELGFFYGSDEIDVDGQVRVNGVNTSEISESIELDRYGPFIRYRSPSLDAYLEYIYNDGDDVPSGAEHDWGLYALGRNGNWLYGGDIGEASDNLSLSGLVGFKPGGFTEEDKTTVSDWMHPRLTLRTHEKGMPEELKDQFLADRFRSTAGTKAYLATLGMTEDGDAEALTGSFVAPVPFLERASIQIPFQYDSDNEMDNKWAFLFDYKINQNWSGFIGPEITDGKEGREDSNLIMFGATWRFGGPKK